MIKAVKLIYKFKLHKLLISNREFRIFFTTFLWQPLLIRELRAQSLVSLAFHGVCVFVSHTQLQIPIMLVFYLVLYLQSMCIQHLTIPNWHPYASLSAQVKQSEPQADQLISIFGTTGKTVRERECDEFHCKYET